MQLRDALKTFGTAVAVASVLLLPLANASELRIRKELLEKQADRALITVKGRFDHVKDTVNSLEKDCDLHAPIRAQKIRLAIVGEFMNACSKGIKPAEVRQLTKTTAVEIEGVFRVWFEHAGKKDEVLTEEEPLAAYTSPNPPHAVEIHPIVRVGQKKFFHTIGPIEKEGRFYRAKTAKTLAAYLKRKITLQEFLGSDGEEYVSIESGGSLPNYFRLNAELASAPKQTADGHEALVDVLDGDQPVTRSLRVMSIAGTAADADFNGLSKGKQFTFWGISRLNLQKVLDALEESPGEPIAIPIELVILAVESN